MYSLNCKSLHLTNKVIGTDTYHRLHKIIHTPGIEGDALKQKVSRPACCTEDRLNTGASFKVIQLCKFISMNASNQCRIIASRTSFLIAFNVWVVLLIFEHAKTCLPETLPSLNSLYSSMSFAFSSAESLLYSSLYAATRSGKILLFETS